MSNSFCRNFGALALVGCSWFFLPSSASASEACFFHRPSGTYVYPEAVYRYDAGMGTVVTSDPNGAVNVRSGPGTGYESYGQLSNGARVSITAHAMAADCQHVWLQIVTGGFRNEIGPITTMWVREDFLNPDLGFGYF